MNGFLPLEEAAGGNDRMLLAVIVAAILHLLLILGVGFSRETRTPSPPGLEVTLAQYSHSSADERADFIAQSNQRGSGEAEPLADPGTLLSSDFDARIIQEIAQEAGAIPRETSNAALLRSQASVRRETSGAQQQSEAQMPNDSPAAEDRSAAEIASLRARLAEQQQAYARLPRVHRLTSASTRAATEAAYLFNWKQRIETIGNRNYPMEARRRQLFGDLRVLVVIRPDGSLKHARVLHSSGQRTLDDAALQIVRLAAPFEPFPPELRARADEIEIIRTWQFRSDRMSASE
jgi:periplasmic protein TonB